MLQDEKTLGMRTKPELSSHNSPFADAILSFIDELRDNEDRKSIFYKEVVQVACHLYINDKDYDQSLLSATGLQNYISELQIQHRKKSGIRKMFAFAQPLIEGLTQYTQAVDVMVQADPTVSALIYGGAKLVLQLANDFTKYFDQITVMLEEIGVQLQCFQIYAREFSTDKFLSGILCNSYRDILLFWRDASKILNQRGKRFFASGLFVPFKERYGKFKAKLDKNAQSVDRMTQALHIQSQGNFSRTQNLQIQDLTHAISRSNSPRPPDYSDSDAITQHDEIRKWISGGRYSRIDPQTDLERHLLSRHIGTAEWIFTDPLYTKWHSSGESSGVWLNAAPGSGKSVLAASMIENLQRSQKKGQKNVIYFFCRFDEPEKCKAISALRSLAIQALKLVKYIPDDLYELYQEEFSAEDCFVANIAIAEKVLGYLLKRIDYVSIIIDGLDECRESVLLDSLVRLRSQKVHGITKWLFTSRNDPIVRKKFEHSDWDILTVPNEVVQKDIRIFLEDNSDLLCGTCDQLDRIADLSEGNFLMMRLTIDPFRNEDLTCSEEFEEALDTFQPELGRCWFRSLERLLQRSEQIQELAVLIFQVVLLAAQPMTFNELIDLLSVKIGEEPSSRRRRTRSVILSACQPFIEVDYDKDFVNPTLRLVHKSIGEFLSQDPLKTAFVTPDCYKFFVRYEAGHTDIGRRCIQYLTYKRYENFSDLNEVDAPEHGLLKYASIFWYKHIEHGEKNKALFDIVRAFMVSPNFWTCIRVQAKYAPHTFAKLSFNSKTDYFRMLSPSSKITPDQEYYADALPPWIADYDGVEDNLVWGYHMFVREWGEVLIRHPDKIQQYFAKVLGSRGFWYTKDGSDNLVNVLTFDSNAASMAISGYEGRITMREIRPQISSIEDGLSSSLQVQRPSYVSDIISKTRGSWHFGNSVEIRNGTCTASISRYTASTDVNYDGDDSDSDDDDGSDNEKKTQDIADEHTLWFLSVINSRGTVKWVHHISTKGSLQRSYPIFVSSSRLAWLRDELDIMVLDTDAFDYTMIKLPQVKIEEKGFVLTHQDYHYDNATNLLYRAFIYVGSTEKCIIRHTTFNIDLFDTSRPTAIVSSQDALWSRPSSSLDLPVSFTWHASTLYASLGLPTVKILRFPSSASPTTSPPIQILTPRLFIPSSSYTRNLHFTITPTPASTSSKKSSLQASFLLDALPAPELPSVVLRFMLMEDAWEDYDFKKCQKEEGGVTLSSRFWKGSYAAKEQAFTVPIRSGLDWRRSVYVTCW